MMRSGPTTRVPGHRNRILALLRHRAETGVLNTELTQLCMRFGARIYELRKQGFSIETRCEGEGLYRFILQSEPVAPKPLPTYQERIREAERKAMPLFVNVGAA